VTELNQTLIRALQVTEILQLRRQLSLKELAITTGFSKQSILRCLDTLIFRGWVRKRVNDGCYIWIGLPTVANNYNCQDWAKQCMGKVQQLSLATGLVADLALLDEHHKLTIVDSTRLRGSEGININVTGYQPSLAMTALGRAFWFAKSELKFNQSYQQILNTADLFERIYLQQGHWRQELECFQEYGYTQRLSTDYIPQIVKDSAASKAFAVAIIGPDEPLGALNLVWDKLQLDSEEVIKKHLPALLKCAEDIHKQLLKTSPIADNLRASKFDT